MNRKLSFLAGVLSTFAFSYVACHIMGKTAPGLVTDVVQHYEH